MRLTFCLTVSVFLSCVGREGQDDPPQPDAGVTTCADGEAAEEGFFGDCTEEPEAELLVFRGEARPTVFAPNTNDIELRFGIQGGWMTVVGARVRNMDITTLQVSAAIFDDCQEPPRPIGRAQQVLDMEIDGDWGVPRAGLANFAGIELCENLDSVRDADGHSYRLDMRVTDGKRRTVVLGGVVVPTCPSPDPVGSCACLCDASYVREDRQCMTTSLDDSGEPDRDSCPATR
jgi:hypothetical protein